MTTHLSILDQHGNPYPVSAMSTGFETSTTESEYEGASLSRRLSSWGLSASGPNTMLAGPLHALRARSRTVIRNNPVATGMVDSYVSNLVGTDISPRWNLDDTILKEALQELWFDSQEELDAAGVYDFYGLEEQIAMAVIDAGEALARFRSRRLSDGLLVPMQIQLLEADHLDANYNTIAPNGNVIRFGIEWDKLGRRAAYWLFREHPGEQYLGLTYAAGERVRVPASEILHVFRPRRINQARGCPWLTPLLVKLHELDQFDDATLVRKKVAALFSVFFTSPAPIGSGALPGGLKQQKNNQGKPISTPSLEPGLAMRLKPGEDVKTADPADVGDNYKDFVKQQLRILARGLGITYEQASGDLEGVTFSSIRSGLIEFRRQCEMLQAHTLVFQFCRPAIRRWLDTAVLSNAVKISDYIKNRRKYWRITWQPDAWDFVDPLKDRLAEQMDIRNGLDSRTAKVAKRGRDVERVDAEIKTDNDRADKNGLVLDSDPRQTAKSGALQKAEENAFTE